MVGKIKILSTVGLKGVIDKVRPEFESSTDRSLAIEFNTTNALLAKIRSGETFDATLLKAADELFYGDGIRTVGVDQIAEKAGVTKRTLYYHFRSKDDLIAAYLDSRDEPTLRRFMDWLDQSEGTLAAQIAGVFHKVAGAAGDAKWKGCGFLRAAAELAGAPGHPALQVGSRHKKRCEPWLQGRIAAEGLSDPPRRARQLMVKLDGAIAEILMHRDPSYAEVAGQIAASLLRPDTNVPVSVNRRTKSRTAGARVE